MIQVPRIEVKAVRWWWPPDRRKAKLAQKVYDYQHRELLERELAKQNLFFRKPKRRDR